ncbi:MAG TPA: ThuA domain-containing protein [Puia sp.]|jgi:type 1 glutamine amidotransferase
MRSFSTGIKMLSAATGALLVIVLLVAARSATPNPSAATAPSHFANPKVLIFSKTNGYRHASIVPGIAAIKKLGSENGFDVDATEDSTWFNTATLKKYAALIFLSPTGTVFGPNEEKALQEYIHNGGGFVGVHAATDCEYHWQWYGDLVGAYFLSHPKPQMATFNVIDKHHPATKGLPNPWQHFDELYNFKYVNPNLNILLKIDEKSYTGGVMGDNHPMSWYHAYEGGRAFYTELGHTEECYTDPVYLGHLLGGIKYAIGKK